MTETPNEFGVLERGFKLRTLVDFSVPFKSQLCIPLFIMFVSRVVKEVLRHFCFYRSLI